MLDTNKIGKDAGVVYETLLHHYRQTPKELRKLTKLKEKEVLLAIGWLAREGKLEFKFQKDDVYLDLVR